MKMTAFSKEELERYSRQLILPELGRAGQEKLKQARVLVIGAGGLGCPALQYLAGAGVGTIGVIDGDTVAVSNLHRQLLFTREDAGKNKALAAVEKLYSINPFIQGKAFPFFLDADNARPLISDYDLVIDGSDNFSTRYLVNDACVISGKPFIYAALHKFELQLAVFNWKEGPTYRCLYPDPPAEGEMPSCAEAGVIGVLPGLAGIMQALEAIKLIIGTGRPLSGQLLIMDLLNHHRQLVTLPLVPENREIKSIHPVQVNCKPGNVPEIDIQQLEKWLAGDLLQLIDVRSPAEFEAFRLNKGEINLPLDQLESHRHLLDPGKRIVFLCQTGSRSKKAARLLKTVNERLRVFSLKNGISNLSG
ncbi:adenylyltransferase/sulfurtransferase [Anseongella ginsenosidimutans]|uniref:Molybdopterin-synthase adenylyltransferase n=3 Tax=Anseongella ginsenosidimutans TaxID=496056 RepID=A0A4R3KNC4_9SPHI|nr:adenylyltransferase/sulfurtransferase [Anseongella ginsenosidimutans]